MADEAGNSPETTITTQYSSVIPTEGASSLVSSSSTDMGEETSSIGRPEPSETESIIIIIKPDGDKGNDVGDEDTPIDDSTALSRNSTSPSTTTTVASSRLSPFLAHVTAVSSSIEVADSPYVLALPDTNSSASDSIQSTINEEVDPAQQMRSSATTTVFSETPPKADTSRPSSSGSPTQNSHASAQQPTSIGDFSVDSLPTPVPVPFTSARTITVGDGIYVVSSFTSTFTTILPNGVTATTSAVYETTLSFADTQSNGDENNVRGVGHPDISTGPPEPVQNSPTSFFKRPAAAAGVFVVVSLVLGCVVWMFLILRRHRRQAATGTQGKGPKYAYGATGYSSRQRGSYMSYDARNWPERFEEENHTAPSTPPPPPAAEPPEEPRWRPGYVQASLGQDELQMSAVHEPQTTSSSSRPQHGRTPSVQALIPSTSTPPQIPVRSPHRPWSPPVQNSVWTTNISPSQDPGQEHIGTYSPDLLPPLLPICRSTSAGRRPRIRTSSSTSSSPHLYTHPSPTSVTQDPTTQSKGPHPIVLLRRTSDRSTGSPVENPFSSSAYIVPSPPPSSHGLEPQERLSNPFSDAESPPHSPVALRYIHDRIDTTQNFPLERGVSLRRTDSLRDKPQRRHSIVTPEPGLMERGSSCGPGSGSEGASSSYNSHLAFRLDTGYRPAMKYNIPRRSGSLSTAETSVVSPKDEISSPIESELFYNPDFASPVGVTNPPFPETAR
ncbi:hypothetical protein FRC14_007000 [Serendipita sp. 396]|nr:hypothetical protein FRC14_007000 [Serendipita sp. 396]